MKALLGLVLFAMISVAQAQPQTKKPPKVAGQAKNSTLNETKLTGCDKDRIAVPNGKNCSGR